MLYAKVEKKDQVKDKMYYNLCPKLKVDQRTSMEEDITLAELRRH
jgi:hypothetical protein